MPKRVSFLVNKEPSGDLAMRRKHARRVTPYPAQMQALIDAQLLTADYYEAQRTRKLSPEERAEAAALLYSEDKPHVLREMWDKVMRALGCV